MSWISVQEDLPENRAIVKTKIDDANGVRNEQELYRNGNLWWLCDGSMYCYYTPTHWMPIAKGLLRGRS